MTAAVSVVGLNKVYDSGFKALEDINLEIQKGEIIALLGPNGAGKTTLISIICGLVTASSGFVSVDGYDTMRDYRIARSKIGLVPQELTTESFGSVRSAVKFSRGLFGKPSNMALIDELLHDLSLSDKADTHVMMLSGGMKRRVMIAKALSHEPEILFLDEPSAGVDVDLRRDMWRKIGRLREQGVTVVLTTHYIEEAEEIADRIAVINKGRLLLVENKADLMHKLGKKSLTLELNTQVKVLPESLSGYDLTLSEDGWRLDWVYDQHAGRTGITSLLNELRTAGITFRDINTSKSSLEDIFVKLVRTSK